MTLGALQLLVGIGWWMAAALYTEIAADDMVVVGMARLLQLLLMVAACELLSAVLPLLLESIFPVNSGQLE